MPKSFRGGAAAVRARAILGAAVTAWPSRTARAHVCSAYRSYAVSQLATALQDSLDECQGVGTVTELQQSERGVELLQRYASGAEKRSCATTVVWRSGTSRSSQLRPNAPSMTAAALRKTGWSAAATAAT